MFNFLKKKLKRFEERIEAELKAELKEEKKQETPPIKPPVVSPKEEQKTLATPVRHLEKKIREKPVPPPVSKGRQEREQQLDKQIEESIETELQRIVQTRKSIEEAVQTEKKTGWGIDEKKLDDLLWDLEMDLLESDVAYSVIESIKKDIKEELKHAQSRSQISEFVEAVLKKSIANVLTANNFDFVDFIEKRKKPVVIMFVGVNGTGKTLSIAKIAYMLKKQGKTCVMAAGDTFRAGAIEQLQIHADNLDVKVVKHGSGADPAAVAFDAIEHAKAKHKDVVLLDTAGRMQTNSNLMDEMAKIKRVAKPDMIIFVGDALSGNDAVEQAKRFNEIVGIDGVILTKVDADAKGGSSLSIAYTIGKPLLFIGVGQKYEDQIPFNAEWMVQHIFGKNT
ncbi:MAG: signal recognition particle-docking protein FtsY [Methanobacteriota archaeon]